MPTCNSNRCELAASSVGYISRQNKPVSEDYDGALLRAIQLCSCEILLSKGKVWSFLQSVFGNLFFKPNRSKLQLASNSSSQLEDTWLVEQFRKACNGH